MRKAYRIISIEAADIYRHEQENGVSVGYKTPESKSDAYFKLFKIYLDNSLDSVELENAYKRVYRKKFSFQDKSGNEYTLAVINLKFNYTYKFENGKPIKIKDLRAHFYENGFYLDGIHYVRYKRSAGSSREGKCLFIDERLYKAMDKWSSCGLKAQTDLVSWESYKALSLSSIKGTVNIPLHGILFVPDYKSVFTEEVISVELKDSKLVAEQKQTEITNDIWDGESLLDESVFENGYADKHMLLLRNKFFKSCAFRTKLQKWIKDKNITLDDIKKRGFTLATDVSQIVMVTTPNSLKYLKFAGGLSEKNIRKCIESVDNTFGVVKWDKGTRFFHGDMVQSSYQLLNTLGVDKAQAEELLKPSFDYITLVRNDVEFMRYHFIVTEEVDLGFESTLELHSTYTRAQLLAGLDFLENYAVSEGIKYLKDKDTDLLFITLNKANKYYSPTTAYHDYSISDKLFHWQSQSTTSDTSATGMRYRSRDGKFGNVLLFVREAKSDEHGPMPFVFLGKAKYSSHTGSRPMSIIWELENSIPAKFLKRTNKLI